MYPGSVKILVPSNVGAPVPATATIAPAIPENTAPIKNGLLNHNVTP